MRTHLQHNITLTEKLKKEIVGSINVQNQLKNNKLPESLRTLLGVGDTSFLVLFVPTSRSKSPIVKPEL